MDVVPRRPALPYLSYIAARNRIPDHPAARYAVKSSARLLLALGEFSDGVFKAARELAVGVVSRSDEMGDGAQPMPERVSVESHALPVSVRMRGRPYAGLAAKWREETIHIQRTHIFNVRPDGPGEATVSCEPHFVKAAQLDGPPVGNRRSRRRSACRNSDKSGHHQCNLVFHSWLPYYQHKSLRKRPSYGSS